MHPECANMHLCLSVESLVDDLKKRGTKDTIDTATRKTRNRTWRTSCCRPRCLAVRENTNGAIVNKSTLKTRHPHPTAVLTEKLRFRLLHPGCHTNRINEAGRWTHWNCFGRENYCILWRKKMKERTDSYLCSQIRSIPCWTVTFFVKYIWRIKLKPVNCFRYDLLISKEINTPELTEYIKVLGRF